MESLWRYMLLILILAKFVAPQCVGSEDCDCHCYCCSYPGCITTTSRYCTSCAKGWSGIIGNRCQRQNVAYNAAAISTSTSGNYFARNAVDDDVRTYALTNTEENPQLTLALSNIFKIKNIFLSVYAYRNSIYNVFVTNSASRVPSEDKKCIVFLVNARNPFEGNVACNKILTGDQIVIQIASISNTLLVYEVKVHQCSQGTYGDLCELECRNCVNNRCDGYTGVCESGCYNGWQGEKCDVNCNSNCEYKTCNQDTGFCTKGCKTGWYGDTCNRLCPSKCESPCDRSLGCTNCPIGHNEPNCDQCNGKTYGKNCSLICQNCITCNNVDGCRECLNGFFGDLCDFTCPNKCKNDKCFRQSGNCIDGCKDGYTGAKCETSCTENCATCNATSLCISCSNGRFGTNCEYRCPETCGGSKTCDRNNGVCSECNSGFVGPNCTQRCSENCSPSLSGNCDRNGACISGCVDKWFGPKCDKQCPIENCIKCKLLSSGSFSCEFCNIGYYLENVQEIRKCVKCPSNCVSCYNGNSCTKCLPGYYGTNCTYECYQNCFNCTSNYNCEICKPGFYGNSCYYKCLSQCRTCDLRDSCTSCREGWSGQLCQCSEHCENEDCNDNGICQSGCKGSYYGERCDVPCPSKDCQRCDQLSGNCTECSDGLYGINCIEKCSVSCLGTTCNLTGACLKGCVDGFAGIFCTKCE